MTRGLTEGGSRGEEQPAERSEADKLRIPPGSWDAPKERATSGKGRPVFALQVLQFLLGRWPQVGWRGGRLDRNEQEVGAPMLTEPPAPAFPARTASDRLHVLLCHADAAGDLPTLEEVVAHALESLGTVLGADRGAIALVGSDGALTVAGSRGLSPQSLAAIEALPVG